MPWSATKTIPALENKSEEVKRIFADAANSALDRGRSEEEAVFAGLAAVKNHEKKIVNKSAVKVPISLHKKEEVEKAVISTNTKVSSAQWGQDGRLILNMSDGKKVVSPPIPFDRNVEQHVTVTTNPVFPWVQMNTQANIPAEERQPGMLTWNETEDCLDIVQADGSTLQVGLENYIEVRNPAMSTLQNGKVVGFIGVDNETPLVGYAFADPSGEPLRTIGLLTNDVPANSMGRATILGKVRNLNTTGSSVGETWVVGNTLWVHPTIPGEMTIVRPSAPHPSISMGAVLKVHATEGVIGVRPVTYPRLFYGTFHNNNDIIPALANTPYPVDFPDTSTSSGVVVENGSQVKVLNNGFYAFDFSIQLTSTNSSDKDVYIWYRINGVDIPETASRVSLKGNAHYVVASWNFFHIMQASDYFQLMFAASDTGMRIDSPGPTGFCPAIPSALLRVSKFDL